MFSIEDTATSAEILRQVVLTSGSVSSQTAASLDEGVLLSSTFAYRAKLNEAS